MFHTAVENAIKSGAPTKEILGLIESISLENINAHDGNGKALLHLLIEAFGLNFEGEIRAPHPECQKLLMAALARGADPKTLDARGASPLFRAIELGSASAVGALLDCDKGLMCEEIFYNRVHRISLLEYALIQVCIFSNENFKADLAYEFIRRLKGSADVELHEAFIVEFRSVANHKDIELILSTYQSTQDAPQSILYAWLQTVMEERDLCGKWYLLIDAVGKKEFSEDKIQEKFRDILSTAHLDSSSKNVEFYMEKALAEAWGRKFMNLVERLVLSMPDPMRARVDYVDACGKSVELYLPEHVLIEARIFLKNSDRMRAVKLFFQHPVKLKEPYVLHAEFVKIFLRTSTGNIRKILKCFWTKDGRVIGDLQRMLYTHLQGILEQRTVAEIALCSLDDGHGPAEDDKQLETSLKIHEDLSAAAPLLSAVPIERRSAFTKCLAAMDVLTDVEKARELQEKWGDWLETDAVGLPSVYAAGNPEVPLPVDAVAMSIDRTMITHGWKARRRAEKHAMSSESDMALPEATKDASSHKRRRMWKKTEA